MKKENNVFKQEKRLVGGIVSQSLADKLSLYCLYSTQSRSQIILNLLEQKLSAYSEEEMINEIGKQLSEKVKGLVTSKKVDFLSKAHMELQKKKISIEHINQIIKIARLSHAKNKD